MYAVIEAGGKQYKVAKNDIIKVEKMESKKGSTVTLDKILLASDGKEIFVGTPYVKGSNVICEILGDIRDDKVIAYKYKRRKSEKKKIGHRQTLTELKVKTIEIGKG